ncbi:AhpC/TSA family protein [Aestuariibacter halophilus]|uniref:thioredoxin-dependent peroxiredoxin n=1 Tax=Fluctibacter halophilus TaxID=226011 RepID=A0ABS8GAD1_9ALTE|nr:peroxiredoxin-like family protein [Aestuariibacter halophilus]MCC2617549.1 AhpC/TSA family protein [Aestuariibacter halophilus]
MHRILLFIALCLSLSLADARERPPFAQTADEVSPLLIGQQVPTITLYNPDGAPVSLRALLLEQPAVVVFYRGGWCPYCNRQLADLKSIEPQLQALGYQILAISPETPARLREQKMATTFAAQLYSDQRLNALRGFGIGFYLDPQTTQRYEQEYQIPLTYDPDGKRPVLPAPAVYIVDQQGRVLFNYVNPNFKVRLSAELLLEAARLSDGKPIPMPQ